MADPNYCKCSDHLKAVRSMGFDTLDDFLDNSYDKIQDDVSAYESIATKF